MMADAKRHHQYFQLSTTRPCYNRTEYIFVHSVFCVHFPFFFFFHLFFQCNQKSLHASPFVFCSHFCYCNSSLCSPILNTVQQTSSAFCLLCGLISQWRKCILTMHTQHFSYVLCCDEWKYSTQHKRKKRTRGIVQRCRKKNGITKQQKEILKEKLF